MATERATELRAAATLLRAAAGCQGPFRLTDLTGRPMAALAGWMALESLELIRAVNARERTFRLTYRGWCAFHSGKLPTLSKYHSVPTAHRARETTSTAGEFADPGEERTFRRIADRRAM